MFRNSAYLYFVNDAFIPWKIEKGIRFRRRYYYQLRKASEIILNWLKNTFQTGREARGRDDCFSGTSQKTVFIYVPKNVVLDRPIQIVNIMRSDVDFMANSQFGHREQGQSAGTRVTIRWTMYGFFQSCNGSFVVKTHFMSITSWKM